MGSHSVGGDCQPPRLGAHRAAGEALESWEGSPVARGDSAARRPRTARSGRAGERRGGPACAAWPQARPKSGSGIICLSRAGTEKEEEASRNTHLQQNELAAAVQQTSSSPSAGTRGFPRSPPAPEEAGQEGKGTPWAQIVSLAQSRPAQLSRTRGRSAAGARLSAAGTVVALTPRGH